NRNIEALAHGQSRESWRRYADDLVASAVDWQPHLAPELSPTERALPVCIADHGPRAWARGFIRSLDQSPAPGLDTEHAEELATHRNAVHASQVRSLPDTKVRRPPREDPRECPLVAKLLPDWSRDLGVPAIADTESLTTADDSHFNEFGGVT